LRPAGQFRSEAESPLSLSAFLPLCSRMQSGTLSTWPMPAKLLRITAYHAGAFDARAKFAASCERERARQTRASFFPEHFARFHPVTPLLSLPLSLWPLKSESLHPARTPRVTWQQSYPPSPHASESGHSRRSHRLVSETTRRSSPWRRSVRYRRIARRQLQLQLLYTFSPACVYLQAASSLPSDWLVRGQNRGRFSITFFRRPSSSALAPRTLSLVVVQSSARHHASARIQSRQASTVQRHSGAVHPHSTQVRNFSHDP
jgi:hypothetical protein